MAEDYTAELNKARAKKRFKSITQQVVTKISQAFVQRMMKAIDDKQSWVWFVVFSMAALNDLSDLFFTSPTFVGNLLEIIINLFTSTVLTMFLWEIGGMIKFKITVLIWLAGSLESLASITVIFGLIGIIPTYIFCLLYARHLVNKRAEIAEKGLEDARKGKINQTAAAEFSS